MPTASHIFKPAIPPSPGAGDCLDVAVDTFEARPGRHVVVGHHHHRGLAYWHVQTSLRQAEGATHQQRLTFAVQTLPRFIQSLLRLKHDLEHRGLL